MHAVQQFMPMIFRAFCLACVCALCLVHGQVMPCSDGACEHIKSADDTALLQIRKTSKQEEEPAAAASPSDVPDYDADCLKDVIFPGGDRGTWESIVECTEFAVDNYKNPWCDDYVPDWQTNFVCGDPRKSEPKTDYALVDSAGNPTGSFIQCYIENEGGSWRRIIKFPPGRFALTEQVWVPPNTSVFGFANPNDAGDRSNFAGGQQTYFVVKKEDALNNDYNPNFFYMSYCVPWIDADHEGTAADPSQGQGTDPLLAKRWRKGFNMHSNTVLQNVLIQGSDEFRPAENGNLCGGGAIETPGCISHYGGNFDRIPEDAGVDGNKVGVGCHDYANFQDYGAKWVTGGYKQFEATSNVQITNVRVNDPSLSSIPIAKSDDPKDWPATQVGLLFPGVPDSSMYLNNITVTNFVGMTSVADGINLHTSMYGVSIVDSYVADSGDDALAIWAGPTDVKDVTFRRVDVVNPGVRQDPQYDFGSCFAIFGVHSVTIDGLRCWDRTCPQQDQAVPDQTKSPWGMCKDWANGHLIVVRTPDHNGFDGHYDYGQTGDCDECGPAEIIVPDMSGLEYYYLNTMTPVESSDPIGFLDGNGEWVRAANTKTGEWVKRSKIHASDQESDWGDAVLPQVCTAPGTGCNDISVR